MEVRNSDLFLEKNNILEDVLNKYIYPYEILPVIHDYIIEIGNRLGDDYIKKDNNIWISKTATIGEGVEIIGPAIIMDNVVVRHNAYIRENVIIGSNSVVGNSSEVKNSILIKNVQIPHFNYVGDSILGSNVHLGAGAIISNLKSDKSMVKVNNQLTNLRKIGAFIGDNVEIGCNSVICPGTIIMPNSIIYPLTMVRNIVMKNSIIKHNGIVVERI